MKPTDSQSQDDVLLDKLTQIVLENLQNEQFSVENLAEEIGISRSHLHRKLKLLKGQSISLFIRVIRLEEAMKLLQKNVGTASEIAYQVGFNSSSYFHKCFQEHYGYSPGDVKKGTYVETDSSRPEGPSFPDIPLAETFPDVSQSVSRKNKWFILASIVLVVATLGGGLYIQLSLSPDLEGPRSIAVLPLRYLLDNEEQEYLAVGMHDGINVALGQLSGLRVISRTSTLRYRQSNQLLPEIAQELGVDALVEGSVRGSGDSVYVQLQLIEAQPIERQLWAKEYPYNLSEALARQSDMVRNIAREIHVRLTPQEEKQLAHTPAVHPDAYKAYLKGMFYWDKLTEEGLNKAMNYFELALEIDPDYALAYSGIALVWGGRMQQGLSSYYEGGANIKIVNLKTKLKELDQDIAEIHYVLGIQSCWMNWNYEESKKELLQTIALNPNMSLARAYLSHVLNILHQPEAAMEQIEIALKLDPFNPLVQALYGMDMMYARQFDKAIETLTQTLETAPTDPVALSTLRTAYHMKGMYPEALQIWETSYAAKNDPEALEALLRGAHTGGYPGALEELAQTLIARSQTRYVTPWQIGTLFTRAGNKAEALHWLEKAYEAHDSNMPYIGVDPIFDLLRDEPRFQDLMKRMKLPASGR